MSSTAPPDTHGNAARDAVFAALADTTRRAMIQRLAHGDATVSELGAPFDLTHQAISRHVGVLRRCGLITQRVDGQRRPCSLDVARMRDIEDWIAEQRRQWSSRLDRLDQHLSTVQEDAR